jgi:L-2-hydroxyglutarate oxidase LhgO
MEEVLITIIGAGVVGLAVAAEVSKEFKNVLVLEKEDSFGRATSSRNSEVIHSGIYYPTGSLKAALCVQGSHLLYEYCRNYGIPHSRIGKLIVATDEKELPLLKNLFSQGITNGVENFRILEKNDISRIEPEINALAAIHSPDTGIIDSHILMQKLYDQAYANGVLFSYNSEVDRISHREGGYELGVKNDDYRFRSRTVINCGGLYSDKLAQLSGIDIENAEYSLRFCKGTYFSYMKASPVKRLIYPLPEKNLEGLGVHATLNLAGYLKFGPDVEYVDKIDYSIDDSKREVFYQSASKLIKSIQRESLNPDMAGIRPKLNANGFSDFVIKHESDRSLAGLINLIGIESPGLTASLAIARHIREMISIFLN